MPKPPPVAIVAWLRNVQAAQASWRWSRGQRTGCGAAQAGEDAAGQPTRPRLARLKVIHTFLW
jgi:hypothetical protein